MRLDIKAINTANEEAKSQQALLGKKINRIGTFRLLAALLAVLGFIGGIKEASSLYYGVGVLGVVFFVWLLFKHGQANNEMAYIESKLAVLERYRGRLNSDWKTFEQDGHQFLRPEDTISNDLDIFGKSSLYQYLSTAHTIHGQEALAKALTAPDLSADAIVSRQEAVAELVERWSLAVHFEGVSAMVSGRKQHLTKETVEQFLKYAERGNAPLASWLRLAAWILPVVTIGAVVLALLGIVPGVIPTVGICLQLALGMGLYGSAMAVLEPLFALHHCIASYQRLFEILEKESFSSAYLKELQKRLLAGDGAFKSIGKLRKIGEAVNLRYNIFLYWPACGLLMWNFHCLLALDRWQREYGKRMRHWLEAVGEFECLLSLAVLPQVKKTTVFPAVRSEQKPYLRVEAIAHPLIEESKVVANSIALEAQTCVITGSNMSGKTTFLRSIGVNLVLAYAGGAVCAGEFETSLMKVFTSMRVHDDVSQGISTFYAEILRIKTMVEYSAKRQPMLVLIDEIFKGTNSADRLIGASAVIRRLSQSWIIALVSTHDFELCDLEKDPQVRAVNYHFSEHYVEDQIVFDYLMRQGRCQTTNAQQLMRMAGIM